MQIFLDTTDKHEVEKWVDQGFVDGITTNPSILAKEADRDPELIVRQLAELVRPLPISVEVCSGEPQEMLNQARTFASWADNIVAKTTVINERGDPCLQVINTLESEGIPVNCTACMSFNQAMLAAKAGATYVSILVGRDNDEGNDGPGVVRTVRQWLDDWGYGCRIIAGSVRSPIDVQQAAVAGAHAITVPPKLLHKLVDHRYSRATVQQFLDDGRKLGEEFGRSASAVGAGQDG